MKDTTGYLKRILIFFSFTLFLLFSIPSQLHAEDEFKTAAEFKHTISKEENIETTIDISIKANDHPRVLSFYTITLEEEDVEPEVSLTNSDKEVNATVYHRDGATDVAVTFKELVISETQSTILRLSFTKALNMEGNKITINSGLSGIEINSVTILYPKTFGDILWSSNTLSKFSAQGDFYKAEMRDPSSKNTIIVLGDSLSYEFSISRSLNNTLEESSQTFDITLPQDNLTQTLIIESMSPQPDISNRDEEGNLTISYIVQPQGQIDVVIKGQILVLESTVETEAPTNPYLTKRSSYWQLSDSQEISNINRYIDRNWIKLPDHFETIGDLEKEEDKESFYKGVYKYIIARLNVDKSSSSVLQGGSRESADAILQDVSKADADNYADLCVAIYRYYGIPARMNIGYLTDVSGITEDGIFHSWCEYYNSVDKTWIQLDPFLEEYKETDLYKNSLRDHIKILTRGKSSFSPKLAFYSENDFLIENTSSEIKPILDFDSQITFKKPLTTSSFIQGAIYIKNTGNVPITRFSILEENLPISSNIDAITSERTLLLLPGEEISIPFNIAASEMIEFQESNSSVDISLSCSSESQISETKSVISEVNIEIPSWVKLLSFFISAIILCLIIFLVYLGYKKVKA